MEANIILRTEARKKTTIEELEKGEGFIDHTGDLRIKISSEEYIRLDKSGRLCELNKLLTSPNVSGAVKKFEFTVREI